MCQTSQATDKQRNLVIRLASVNKDEKYINKIKKFIDYKKKFSNFDDDPISKWKKYTNKIDTTLLFLTYSLNYCLINFEQIKKNLKSVEIELPSSLEGKINKSIFISNIKKLILAFLSKDSYC